MLEGKREQQEVDVAPVCSHPHDMILEASSSSLVDGFNLIDDDLIVTIDDERGDDEGEPCVQPG